MHEEQGLQMARQWSSKSRFQAVQKVCNFCAIMCWVCSFCEILCWECSFGAARVGEGA